MKKDGVITLLLNDYTDIFSSFDPRSYAERSLSVDFLEEAKRAAREKDHKVNVHLLLPASKRKIDVEKTIQQRLKEHFRKHAHRFVDERNAMVREGVSYVLLGIILMLLATFVLFQDAQATFLSSFLIVLLEPAGWFLFWEGLNYAWFEPRKKAHDLLFYKKMANADVLFHTYTQK